VRSRARKRPRISDLLEERSARIDVPQKGSEPQLRFSSPFSQRVDARRLNVPMLRAQSQIQCSGLRVKRSSVPRYDRDSPLSSA
jgi:hypothetical protein